MPNKYTNPHITLSFVSSIDGKITMGDNPKVEAWASKEDQIQFKKLVKNHSVIIIGSRTYEAIKKNLRHETGKLRIVMTSRPERYKKEEIPGRLEFTSKNPKQVINMLSKRGVKKVLLACGGVLAHAFLKAKLVNKFLLTLEPKLFGEGTPLLTPPLLNISLQLKTIERLNKKGTLLLTYTIK
jgi:riboflavin biosynthesis pyrimidine reductase